MQKNTNMAKTLWFTTRSSFDTCQIGRNVLFYIQLTWRKAGAWVKFVLQTHQRVQTAGSPYGKDASQESFICQWLDGAPCLQGWQIGRDQQQRTRRGQECRNSRYHTGDWLTYRERNGSAGWETWSLRCVCPHYDLCVCRAHSYCV